MTLAMIACLLELDVSFALTFYTNLKQIYVIFVTNTVYMFIKARLNFCYNIELTLFQAIIDNISYVALRLKAYYCPPKCAKASTLFGDRGH